MLVNNFAMMTNKRIVGNVKYRNTVVTGEVAAAHINGTYDVKLAGEDEAYINIPTIFTNPDFVVTEMVGVQFGRGNREDPIIIGRDRKKVQTPIIIDYDYI